MANDPIDDIHRHIVHTPFIEFPKHLHKADGSYKVVQNGDEQAEAVKAGWHLTPDAAAKAAAKAEKKAGKDGDKAGE